jgi:hypothetical protein
MSYVWGYSLGNRFSAAKKKPLTMHLGFSGAYDDLRDDAWLPDGPHQHRHPPRDEDDERDLQRQQRQREVEWHVALQQAVGNDTHRRRETGIVG